MNDRLLKMKRSLQTLVALSVLIMLAGLSCARDETPSESARVTPLRGLLIPAYFYPDFPDGHWSRLVQAAQTLGDKLIVIVNPANGPGTQYDAKYRQAIAAVRRYDGRVIGYVHTCHGLRGSPESESPLCPTTLTQIQADIAAWYTLYPDISGIFFDEVSSAAGDVATYRALYHDVQRRHGGTAVVVFNFGVVPHRAYGDIGTALLCLFEETGASFPSWGTPSWISSDRALALIYQVAQAQPVLEAVMAKPIEWFYVTSDSLPNPWDTLPSYFEDLVTFAAEGHPSQHERRPVHPAIPPNP